jgi:hypothetical protein
MLSAGTPYVGGLHGGKNLVQDAVQVFGLVIGDQIGKLINTAGMKLPCPVGASASNSANTAVDTARRSAAKAQQECLWQIAGPEWDA